MDKSIDKSLGERNKSNANNVSAVDSIDAQVAFNPPSFQLKAEHSNQPSPDKEESAPIESPFQLAAEGISPPVTPQSPNDNNNSSFTLNNTGLPTQLKSGVENLSGFSLNDVKVHYNSPKPAQLHAHAYAQGTDIHVASGQEKHLPHEAWHVVQQKQGRVQPTKQLKGNVAVNDDVALENEADTMGAKATRNSENTQLFKKGVIQNKTVQLFNFGRKATDKAKEGDGKNKLTNALESGPASALNDANGATNSATFGLINKLPTDLSTRGNADNFGGTTPGQNVTNSTMAYNATGAAGGAFGILYGMANAIDAFRSGGFSDKLNAIFDIASNTSGFISGLTGMITDHSGDQGVKDSASAASNVTWIGEGAINIVKGAYNTGKEIFYAYKRHNDEIASDKNEKLDRSVTILKGLLNTGADIVKTVRNALSAFNGPAMSAEAVPIVGIITSSFDIITRIIDLIRAGLEKNTIHARIKSLGGSLKGKKKKILSSKSEQKEAKRINHARGKQQELSDATEHGIPTQSWEAIEYLKEMFYINDKRQVRASIKIGVDLVNIGGEIATLTGYGAAAGVPMKVAAATSGLAMAGFRSLKQWGRNKAENAPDESKWKKVFDDSKSTEQKKQKIINDVGFVFRNFTELKNLIDGHNQGVDPEPTDPASPIDKKRKDIQLYVEASGASFSHFKRKYTSSGGNENGVNKAAEYLIGSMKKRE